MPYRPTEKTRQHKAAKYNALLDIALQIVAKDGFKALTVSNFVRQAGIATGSIYSYFGSKSKLCADVFKLATEREVQQVYDASFPKHALPCKERLINAVAIFCDRAILSGQLAYALIAEPVGPLVEAERLKYRKAYADIFEKLIDEGIQNNEFPQQISSISAAAVVGMLAEVFITPLAQDKSIDPNALTSAIQELCVRAVTGLC